MSKFNIKNNINNINKIVYDYYNITVYPGDIKYSEDDKYVKISTPFPLNVPNITYPDNLQNYNAKTMYLTGLKHNNIGNLSPDNYVGELIVEHTQSTGTGKLFTCFLITDAGETIDNDFDKLVEFITKKSSNLSFTLNTCLPRKSTSIVYNSNDDIVIVFTDELKVNTETADFIATNLNKYVDNILNIYENNYIVIPEANVSQRGKDEIYIDCTPTGESSETIATYNVPINSEYTKDAQKLDFMKTTISLSLVFLLVLTTYFTVPYMYKTVIVDTVKKVIELKDVKDNYIGKYRRNIAVDIVICILASLLMVHILMNGIAKDNFDIVLYGIYFFILFGLSASIVGYNRETNYFKDDYRLKYIDNYIKYKNTGTKTEGFEPNSFQTIFLEIIMFIKDSILYTFTGPDFDKNKFFNTISILTLSSVVWIILLIMIDPLGFGTKQISWGTGSYWGKVVPIFIIIPIVAITSLLLKNKSQVEYDLQHPLF